MPRVYRKCKAAFSHIRHIACQDLADLADERNAALKEMSLFILEITFHILVFTLLC